tara:strand:+ start:1242 stop:3332 length:2091 start_codon:yes stop_codon:yes gene_type:complete
MKQSNTDTTSGEAVEYTTEQREQVGNIDGVPVYNTKEEAEQQAREMGLSCCVEMLTDKGATLFTPCATEADERSAEAQTIQRTAVSNFEVRSTDAGAVVSGYAAVYESETRIGNAFNEIIARGAFDKALETADCRALFNHNADKVLARRHPDGSGTLKLTTDEIGLRYEFTAGGQSYAKDLVESLERGDVNSSSFAFTIAKDGQSWNEARTTRTVTEVGFLLDISPVVYPAYPQATAEVTRDACSCKEVEEVKEEEVPVQKLTKQRKAATNINSLMKDSNNLKALRADAFKEFETILNTAETDGGRLPTEAEQQRADYLTGEVDRLDAKLKLSNAREKMISNQAAAGVSSKSEARDIERTSNSFSLSRAAASIISGKQLTGLEAEMKQEADREARACGLSLSGNIALPEKFLKRTSAAGNLQADKGIGTDVGEGIAALREATFLETLGCKVITGATANLRFPRISVGSAGTWEGEVDAINDSVQEHDDLTLTPKRVAATGMYSRQLLMQGGQSIDNLVVSDIAASLNSAIDAAAFGGTGTGGQPTGLLATTGIDDQADSTDAKALLLAMEAALYTNGAMGGDNVHIICSPTAYKLIKSSALVGNVNALYDMASQQANGYSIKGTNFLTDVSTGVGRVVMGNYEQMILTYFGSGVDITVDPYSAGANAQVKIYANRFVDLAARQPKAFSKCDSLTTA